MEIPDELVAKLVRLSEDVERGVVEDAKAHRDSQRRASEEQYGGFTDISSAAQIVEHHREVQASHMRTSLSRLRLLEAEEILLAALRELRAPCADVPEEGNAS